jgi:hypothetical protein
VKKTLLFIFTFSLSIYIPWIIHIRLCPEFYNGSDYVIWKSKFDLLELPKDEFDPEIILLGDSLLTSGVIPELVGVDVYNFGLPGLTPVEAFIVLQRYLQSGRTPKKVFLMIGPTHYEFSDSFWEILFGYQLLTRSEKREVFREMKSRGALFAPEESVPTLRRFLGIGELLRNSHLLELSFWLEELGLSGNYLSRMRLGAMKRISGQSLNYADLLKNLATQSGYTPLNMEGDNRDYNHELTTTSFELAPVFDTYLHRIVTLAKNATLDLTIDWVPINETSFNRLTDEYFMQKTSFMDHLKDQYPKVQIYPLTSYSYDNYLDTDHLSSEGAKRFSREFHVRHFRHLGGQP